jgi:hypothetical protein
VNILPLLTASQVRYILKIYPYLLLMTMARRPHRQVKKRLATPSPRRRAAALASREREAAHPVFSGSSASERKLLVSLEPEDLEWLNTTVATLKSTRRRTSKSEMIRAGLALMRKMTLDQLRELLRNLY